MATIESMAKHQVTVASIASAILEKYGCIIPDSSLYYAIRGLGYAIDSLGNQVLVKKTFKSHTEALLHSLRCCKDVSYAVLFENVEKSTENEVVYETWNRDFVIADSDNVAESLLSTNTVLGGDDLLKEKKMSKDINTENINGRTYDTSRIMDIGGHKKFFIGTIWTQRDELRMFEAFPEVLIMDAKAKTNKLKHAYFAGVGVDAFWLNNTLFRSWVPNQTDAAYTWMTTVGLPAIVPKRILQQVQSLFTDDDGVVNIGLELLQQMDEIFEHANAYLCGYHIVRNFYSEFGQGAKRKFHLKESTTKYRKGGTIVWGHPWQQHCADAIYRMQQCETVTEIEACYRWITLYVKKTKEIARKSLRRDVLRFFAKKYKKKNQWVLAYRLHQRTLDLKSTSRVEGEFSGVHTMRLSTKLGMQKSFHKLRFYADRRRVRKMRMWE